MGKKTRAIERNLWLGATVVAVVFVFASLTAPIGAVDVAVGLLGACDRSLRR